MSESDSFLRSQQKNSSGKEEIVLQELSTTSSNIEDDSVNDSITKVDDTAQDSDVQSSPQSPSTTDGGDNRCENCRMLERQLSVMKEENKELKKDYNKLNGEKAALLREHRSKMDKLEQSSAYVAARLDTVETDNRMLERQVSAMKKENEELKKDYNKLNEEKAALLREHRSKIEKLEQSSAYVAARLDTVEADNSRKDEEIERLKAELDDAAPDRKRARRQS